MKNINEIKIVLASSSPRRKELLNKLTNNIQVIKPNFNEDMISKELENKEEYPLNEALLKRNYVLNNYSLDLSNSILLTCDTAIIFNNKIYGKPKDLIEAYKMLNEFSSSTHKVISGYTLSYKNKVVEKSIVSEVTFNELSDTKIKEYINNNEVLDKAGSYGIQFDDKYHLINKIKGSYNNIVGLPIEDIEIEIKKIINE